MQSSGGIIPARLAAREPVRTVLSGPAGGVIGACQVARWAGFERIIGFDMGGTSTDVFLAESAAGGARSPANRSWPACRSACPCSTFTPPARAADRSPVSMPGGMLRVGPESAGADPGPICFGRGDLPTVTDANLLLGRLDPESFLGGGVQLDAATNQADHASNIRVRSRASKSLHPAFFASSKRRWKGPSA